VTEVKLTVSNVAIPFTYEDGEEADEIVPVPTYFSIGKYALPGSVQQKIRESGGEVTDNLVFLGQLFCLGCKHQADI
jgi:hypothetical protein